MDKELFFVYALGANCELLSEKVVTDAEHIKNCAKHLTIRYGGIIHHNKASFCNLGYLVQGNYLGVVNIGMFD